MKMLILMFIALVSFNSFAQVLPMNSCDQRGLKWMEETIEDWKKDDGFTDIWYIKNLKGQTLGFYSLNPEESTNVHADICHGLDFDNITIASTWYYWDYEKLSSHPSAWKKDLEYRISSDEGIAYFKVIKSDLKGNVKAFMRVVGWGEEDKELTIQSSIVIFEKRR